MADASPDLAHTLVAGFITVVALNLLLAQIRPALDCSLACCHSLRG